LSPTLSKTGQFDKDCDKDCDKVSSSASKILTPWVILDGL